MMEKMDKDFEIRENIVGVESALLTGVAREEAEEDISSIIRLF